MNAVHRMLRDKGVSNLTVAIILGMSIFTFANYLGTSLSRAFFEPGYSWSWDRFFTQLIVLIFGVGAAVIVHLKSSR